ncbi:MAG: hypothetical protein J2P23_05960 [Microlunatus sp.]|nr:hypothetical protein [Microlunatus sp.]
MSDISVPDYILDSYVSEDDWASPDDQRKEFLDWVAERDAEVRLAALKEARARIALDAPPRGWELNWDGTEIKDRAVVVEAYHAAWASVDEMVIEAVSMPRRGPNPDGLPLHRTEANYGVSCSTCDDGGCPDCTDPA